MSLRFVKNLFCLFCFKSEDNEKKKIIQNNDLSPKEEKYTWENTDDLELNNDFPEKKKSFCCPLGYN